MTPDDEKAIDEARAAREAKRRELDEIDSRLVELRSIRKGRRKLGRRLQILGLLIRRQELTGEPIFRPEPAKRPRPSPAPCTAGVAEPRPRFRPKARRARRVATPPPSTSLRCLGTRDEGRDIPGCGGPRELPKGDRDPRGQFLCRRCYRKATFEFGWSLPLALGT